MSHRFDESIPADSLLDAAEEWAGIDWWIIRETVAGVVGRIDALMVPITFDACCTNKQPGGWISKLRIIGIEAKANRPDFLRGLREGQFDRYSESLGGLYVITPRSVKTAEVPEHCGHLVAFSGGKGIRCVCRRRPKFRDQHPSIETLWRLLFLSHNWRRREARERDSRVDHALYTIGTLASRKLSALLRPIAEGMR